MIPVYKPYINNKILSYAYDALESTWVSSHGKYLKLVEDKLKEILNVPFVLLTNNGTTATHLVAKGLAKYMNDVYRYGRTTLIVPNNVYVAAWNSFLYDDKFCLKPVDADISTWNIDLKQLDDVINFEFNLGFESAQVKALLVTHNLGNILNVPELKKKYRNLPIVEDCCEGLFGSYNNRMAGTDSLLASYSFYGNKIVTSGEGGAVVTHDVDLYYYLERLHGQGQTEEKFVHSELGYNYRMTNLEAAILYGQLLDLEEILFRKNELFLSYDYKFYNIHGVYLQQTDVTTIPAPWMYGIRIDKKNHTYKKAEKYFYDKGIEIRPMFYPMSTHQHLQKIANKNNEEVARKLNEQCIVLPSYPELTKDEVDYIAETVQAYIEEIK